MADSLIAAPTVKREGGTRRRCTSLGLLKAVITLLAVCIIVQHLHWNDHCTTHVIAHQELIAFPGLSCDDPTLEKPCSISPGLRSVFGATRWEWLPVYGVAAALLSMALVHRWFTLLVVIEPRVRWTCCLIAWCRSQVLGVLPFGQIGGDVYRVMTARAWKADPIYAAAIIVLERMIGFGCLICIAGVGLILNEQLFANRDLNALIGLGGAFSLLILGGFWGLWKTVVSIQGSHASRFPRWAKQLASLRLASAKLGLNPSRVGIVILLSGCAHVGAAICFVIADRAAGLATPVSCYLVIVPCIMLAQVLPIHVAGIGILEGGLAVSLGLLADLSVAQAIGVAAMVRMLGLIWTAVLATSYLIAIPTPASRAPLALPPGNSLAVETSSLHSTEERIFAARIA